MVVAPQSHIIFRQALDTRSVKESCVSVSEKTAVGQGIKSQIGRDLRINRYSSWSKAATIRCRTERARSGRRRRHGITESIALPLTDGFVVAENEGLTLYNRPPSGGPELVAVKWRYFIGVEVVSRVEHLIADEVVTIAMELVVPRLGDSIDNPAGGPAVLCRIVAGKDRKLLNRVDA